MISSQVRRPRDGPRHERERHRPGRRELRAPDVRLEVRHHGDAVEENVHQEPAEGRLACCLAPADCRRPPRRGFAPERAGHEPLRHSRRCRAPLRRRLGNPPGVGEAVQNPEAALPGGRPDDDRRPLRRGRLALGGRRRARPRPSVPVGGGVVIRGRAGVPEVEDGRQVARGWPWDLDGVIGDEAADDQQAAVQPVAGHGQRRGARPGAVPADVHGPAPHTELRPPLHQHRRSRRHRRRHRRRRRWR